MKPYADAPRRRARQIALDLLCVAWVGWWIWTGANLYVDTMNLTEPVDRTEAASTALGDNLRQTARNLGSIPLIGQQAARPLREAATNADNVALASTETKDSITGLAFWGGLSIALVPTMLAVAFYVVPRVRLARTAAGYRDHVTATGDLDLIALQALTHRSPGVLRRVHPDPVRAWREGDPASIVALAAIELDHAGLTGILTEEPTASTGPGEP